MAPPLRAALRLRASGCSARVLLASRVSCCCALCSRVALALAFPRLGARARACRPLLSRSGALPPSPLGRAGAFAARVGYPAAKARPLAVLLASPAPAPPSALPSCCPSVPPRPFAGGPPSRPAGRSSPVARLRLVGGLAAAPPSGAVPGVSRACRCGLAVGLALSGRVAFGAPPPAFSRKKVCGISQTWPIIQSSTVGVTDMFQRPACGAPAVHRLIRP